MRTPAIGAPVAVSSFDLTGELEATPVPRAPLRLTGSAVVDPEGPAVREVKASLVSEGLFEVVATGEWSPAAGGSFDASLTRVDLARWRGFGPAACAARWNRKGAGAV